MEAGIGSIYFTTTSTVYFNSSEITTNATDDNDVFKWTSEEIARLIQIVVRPILIVFGTVGNGLTFYIMRTTSLKNVSSCFYMSVLGLADSRKSRLY